MQRLVVLALASAFAFACGGRTEDAPLDEPDDAAIPGLGGVCENRIEYSDEPSDQTKLSARIGYDADGHWIRYREARAPGPTLWIARAYDDGLLVRQEENLPRIHPARRHARWEYDAAKRPIKVTFDLEDTPPKSIVDSFGYDDQGRMNRLEARTNGAITSVTTVAFPDADVIEEAHDLAGDGTIEWIWRYRFQSDWLVALESERSGKVDMRETFHYSDLARGELSERDFDTDGDGIANDVDRFTWVDHHVVRSTHVTDSFPEDYPQSVDWAWNGAGHPTVRTWTTPRYAFRTTIDWNGDELVRVARRDATSGQLLERWSFAYGCPAGRPILVRIAPVADWRRETEPMPFVLARADFTDRFPEVW